MKAERAIAIVLGLTAVQFILWMHQFGPHLAAFTDYAARILTGHPDWRAVQNRLLGPFILIHLFGWLPAPLPSFSAVALCVCNVLFYRVARTISPHPLWWLAAYITVWAMLFFKLSFTFDLIEMSVLVGFFSAVMGEGKEGKSSFLEKRSKKLLRIRSELELAPFDLVVVGLFFIQLLNRESALFLAAYLGFCGVLRMVLRDWPELALGEVCWGAVLFAGGAVVIEYLRKTLFIIGPAARAGADLRHARFENFIIYQKNWVFFFVDLRGGWHLAKAPVFLVFLLALHVVLTLVGIGRRHARVAAYGFTMLLYSVAIFFTAELEETRVMQILVPNVALTVAWLIRELHRGCAGPNGQKFFASFFQKRRLPSFLP